MAIWLTTSTPLVLPKKHSRAYYVSHKQATHVLRRSAPHRVPPVSLPPQTYIPWWGTWAATVNRAYQRISARWWSSGNIPNGVPFWAALAATVPLTNNRGNLVTLDAHHWFLWYQRTAIALWSHAFRPLQNPPLYFDPDPPYDLIPFPCWPRAPWNPGPAPSVTAIRANAYGNLEVDILVDTHLHAAWVASWIRFHRNVLPGTGPSTRIQGEANSAAGGSGPWTWTYEILPPGVPRTFQPGLTATIWLQSIHEVTMVFSLPFTADTRFA